MIFIKKGKPNWTYVIFVALFAGAVGGGLMSYINDTVWQTDFLAQTADLWKRKTKTVQVNSNAPVPVEMSLEYEKEFFASFSEKPERADRQTKEAAMKIYSDQEDCLKVNTTTFDMNQCLIAAGKSYDDLLEKRYSQTILLLDEQAKSDPEFADGYKKAKEDLGKAITAWKDYRKALCSAEYNQNIGGTIRSLSYSSCYNTVTLKQVFSL